MTAYSGRILAASGGSIMIPDGDTAKRPEVLAPTENEIIRLTGLAYPHVLVMAHAQRIFGAETETDTAADIQKTFTELFGCESRMLFSGDVAEDPVRTKELLGWADIIYESGGHTPSMMEFWSSTGLGDLLRKEWLSGKVMCGASAGAICWFASGNTDAEGYIDREVNCVTGLGFINLYFSPHCQCGWKRESETRSLRHLGIAGLSVSDCSAIEIADGGFRVIKYVPADPEFRPYVLHTFWKDGEMYEEEFPETEEFMPLEKLLEPRILRP